MLDLGPCLQCACAIATLAIVLSGLAALILHRAHQPKPPSQAEVHQVAALYRLYYGDRALEVLGDHMLGASFSPDERHHALLKRVGVVVSEYIQL